MREYRAPAPRGASLEERLDHYLDTEDGCWVWKGRLYEGYGRITVNGKLVRVHRLVYELFTGEPIPEGMVVNHRCGNSACSRPQHLELATVQQNAQYRTVLDSHNTSGYRGVSFESGRKKWRASTTVNGKTVSLGYHNTAEEANIAAIAGRAKYHGVPEFTDWKSAA